MIAGTVVIREPYIEATCTPRREGGWIVESGRGKTEHPAAGDAWVAFDLHVKETAS